MDFSKKRVIFILMIDATHIVKSYGSLNVIKDLSLSVKKGEIVAIVGPSGAGKTTLLHILSTLDTPDTSSNTSIVLNGTDITQLSDKQMARFRNEEIGFIFQFHQLLPEFTALENVCIPGYIQGNANRNIEKEALELLSLLGLENRIHHKPGELSGGEQQRVAVARALINKPSLLFADEPSGNLDSESAETLHNLFFDLRDRLGLTVIIVTHNPKLADRADRKITMIDGHWSNES